MVDDIYFSDAAPSFSAAGRVNTVDRNQREHHKTPFEKFLKQRDKNAKKKKSLSRISGAKTPEKYLNVSDSDKLSRSGGPTETETELPAKVIDIRI